MFPFFFNLSVVFEYKSLNSPLMKKQFRPFQSDTITIAEKEYHLGILRQLIVMATGLGKTTTAAGLIEHFRNILENSRVLWMTHTEELIEQSVASVMGHLLPEIEEVISKLLSNDGIIDFLNENKKQSSIFYLDYKEKLLLDNLGIIKRDLCIIDRPVVAASVQTLTNRLDRIPSDHFGIIIVDEADLAAAPTWMRCLDHFPNALRFGLTATPERLDGVSLANLFDKQIVEYDIKFGVDNKYLCELDTILVETTVNLDKVRTTAGELNQKDLQIVDCPERNIQIVNKWIQYAQGRPTIAYCVGVNHAQNLCEHFRRKDIKAEFVVADTALCPNRRDIIRDFQAGKIDVVCNVDILTAGFDYPNVGCIIPAAPTKSKRKFLQQIGRGTRLKNEMFVEIFGQNLLILDITDNSRRHHLINTKTLDEGKEIEDRVFISEAKKKKLIEAREARKSKIEHKQMEDQRVNLLTLPKVIFNPYSKAHYEPATEKQLSVLDKLGYDTVNNVYTKMDCMKIISDLPAFDWQITKLEKLGYDVSKGVTAGEASKAFDDYERKKAKRLEKYVQSPQEIRNELKTPFRGIK